MTAAVETNSQRRRRFGPILAFIVMGIVVVPLALAGGMFWSASSTILQPPGPGDRGDLSGCRPETRAVWGEDCLSVNFTVPALRGQAATDFN